MATKAKPVQIDPRVEPLVHVGRQSLWKWIEAAYPYHEMA